MPAPRTRWIPWLAALLLAGLVLAAFHPTLTGEFVDWDDPENLVQNPRWRGFSAEHLAWMFTTPHMGHYHPLTWLSFALDHAWFGADPRALHGSSVAWHAATAVAVFFLARRVLAAWSAHRSGAELAPGTTRLELAAFFAAGLFALHPLRVESVAWLTERRDVVSGLFAVLALSAWCRYVEHGRRARDFLLALVLAVFAWTGKGTAVVLPALFLVLDLGPYARARNERLARLLLEKLPFAVLGALAIPVTLRAAASAGTTLKGVAEHGFLERGAQAAYALVFYPLKSLAPIGLRPIYPLPQPFDAATPAFVAAAASVIAVAVLLFAFRKRAPALAAACAAYVLALLPVSGLLQAGPQLVAERYTYLACVPFALLAGAGFAAAARRALVPVALASVVLLALLGAATARYARAWRSSETLWTHTLAVDASNPHALLHLGTLRYRAALAERDPARRAEELALALRFFEDGMRASSLAELRANTALALGFQAELDPARRAELLAQALARMDEAFALAVRVGGADSVWRIQRAGFLFKLGRADDALAELERYVRERPDDAQGWRTLARAATDTGELATSEHAWRRLAELQPADAAARVELGLALERRGASAEAARSCGEARTLARSGAALPPNLRAELDRRAP
ncbi:MAG: hypothetical protein HZA53_06935 [Planctomycetes bacterium]|nr:hypothetical protein [Planctomycetota bacterium]